MKTQIITGMGLCRLKFRDKYLTSIQTTMCRVMGSFFTL